MCFAFKLSHIYVYMKSISNLRSHKKMKKLIKVFRNCMDWIGLLSRQSRLHTFGKIFSDYNEASGLILTSLFTREGNFRISNLIRFF